MSRGPFEISARLTRLVFVADERQGSVAPGYYDQVRRPDTIEGDRIGGLSFGDDYAANGRVQALRPLKRGLFVEPLGADTELYAKLANVGVAILAVVVFTALYNRYGSRRLIRRSAASSCSRCSRLLCRGDVV